MKTLLIAGSFPPDIGGIAAYLYGVARAFHDYDISVAAPLTQKNDDAFDRQALFKIVRFNQEAEVLGYFDALRLVGSNLIRGFTLGNGRFGMWKALKLLPAITLLSSRSTLKTLGAESRLFAIDPSILPTDIVQAGTVLPSGITAWIIRQYFGTPYVIYTHGMEILNLRNDPKILGLVKRVLFDAAWVGAVSKFTAGLLKDLGLPEDAIRLVPPGINPEPFSKPQDLTLTRKRYNLFGKRIILTHGRLDQRKGHDMVIRALPKVISYNPDTVYLITGTGTNEPNLRELVHKLSLESHVIFGGNVSQEDLPGLYQTCDIFIMASRQIGENVEGFGIVCLEAAAAGRPVIAGRSGGVADAVIDGVTGYLVNPEDPDEIAGKIIRLLNNRKLCDEMGTAGRERVFQDFDINAFAQRVRGYLEDVIK